MKVPRMKMRVTDGTYPGSSNVLRMRRVCEAAFKLCFYPDDPVEESGWWADMREALAELYEVEDMWGELAEEEGQ